jgi:hypothetical protein
LEPFYLLDFLAALSVSSLALPVHRRHRRLSVSDPAIFQIWRHRGRHRLVTVPPMVLHHPLSSWVVATPLAKSVTFHPRCQRRP